MKAKMITAAALTAVMMITAAACSQNAADGESAGEQKKQEMPASQAFDLYNEAIVKFDESNAYDASAYFDIVTGEDGSFNFGMEYEYKDTGSSCEAYFSMPFGEEYYADGVKTTVMGDNVQTEEIPYEDYVENGNGFLSLIDSLGLTREDFETAEITVKNDITTINVVRTGVTELPETFAGYASLLGFDPEEATDISYDDAEVSIDLSADNELDYIGFKAGVSFTDADDNAAQFKVTIDFYVNALGDSVTVRHYN